MLKTGARIMGVSLARRARTLLRFVFPSGSVRRHARALRQSGQFDRAFYIGANPRLRALFRLAPERHYVLFGETLGLSPNPHFAPRAYLFHNPDLSGTTMPLLLHYIETGQREQRRVLLPADQRGYDGPPMPQITTVAPVSAPVAVVVHLFYHDMWPEFAAALQPQRFDFDLFVTITGAEDGHRNSAATDGLKQRILGQFPKARIWVLPNHGRDIFPFVHLVNSGVLAPYRAICKLHTKKSPHRGDGDDWRRALTGGVLGDPAQTDARLATFLGDKHAGFWVANDQFYHGDDWWGPNRPRTEALLARVGVNTKGRALTFPAGSIYWIKPALIRRIREMNLGADDFEPEQALVDGTTAHAMERVLGYLVRDAGLEVREARELDETD